jgi:hypothetical protein
MFGDVEFSERLNLPPIRRTGRVLFGCCTTKASAKPRQRRSGPQGMAIRARASAHGRACTICLELVEALMKGARKWFAEDVRRQHHRTLGPTLGP